jgi:hypothetical protein
MAVKLKDAPTAAEGAALVVLVGFWARAMTTERTTKAKTAGILYFKVSSPSSLNLGHAGPAATIAKLLSLTHRDAKPISTAALQAPE